VPAPLSAFTPPETREASRAVALQLLEAEWSLQGDGAAARASSRDLWHPDMLFYGPAGVGMAQGYEQYATHILAPLHSAFADRRFELDVVACEGAFCGAHGYLVGKQVGCYLGQWPKSENPVRIRVGLHWHVVDGRAKDGYAFYDTPQYFDEAYGIDLFERAISGSYPPPACPSVGAEHSTHFLVREFDGSTPALASAGSAPLEALATGCVLGSLTVALAWVVSHLRSKRRSDKLWAPLLA
jgi:hypothetical protein